MLLFQVSTRNVQLPVPADKRPRHAHERWYIILRKLAISAFIIALIATLLGRFGLSALFFILLPVFVTVIHAVLFRRYNRNRLMLTIVLACVYFSGITWWELLTHRSGTDELIVVGTTLALAVLFEPVRIQTQSFFERRLNLHDETIQAVETFTSTLREEIDLDQLRERLFTLIQQTMQPQSVSLWTRKAIQNDVGNLTTQSEWEKNIWHTAHEKRKIEIQSSKTGTFYEMESSEISVANDDPFITHALSLSSSISIERLHLDSPALESLRNNNVKIVLALASQGELIGLLNLGPRLDGQDYNYEDRNLLYRLAAQVAPALRVAQMVYEQQIQVRLRERIEQELQTAQAIQRTFLPKELPVLLGWQLAPYYQPAREVGGDFYDFLPFEDGRLGIVIGDVTDKGIPAALVMTATRTMIRTAALTDASPGEVLARVNDLLYADIPATMFVTCFYAILDPRNGHLHYANAGHEPPYRHFDGNASELWATGMPLGMMPGSCYEEHETTLAPGEGLLFYSDGLVEAHNQQRDMFGFPRLKSFISKHSDDSALMDMLLRELANFMGDDLEQEDDVTMVALHRIPTSDSIESSQEVLESNLPRLS